MTEPATAAGRDRYLHGAYHPNGQCPNGVCAEPRWFACCEDCGKAIVGGAVGPEGRRTGVVA